jgi:preprotein translocase SecE subunit
LSTQQDRAGATLQLGMAKYLYFGYFLAGCVVAFIVSHGIDLAWGEGHDQVATGAGVAVGIVAVVFGYRNLRLRQLGMEIIEELSAVTWPTRQETYTATVVVIATSVIAASIIFGLDRFWNWITDLIYLS